MILSFWMKRMLGTIKIYLMNTALILGFIFHLVGDYLLQNDWMAQNKTKRWFPCIVHCLLYTLPFGFIFSSSPLISIVFISHYFIDRYRLAQYWIRLVNWKWDGDNFGYEEDKPKWMSVWLLIIIDNTFHILFNSIAIYLLYH